MKKTLPVAVIVVFLGALAGIASAQLTGANLKAVVLKPQQAVTYGGLTCTAYSGTTATNANLVCVRNNLRGYGVIISQDTVVVARKTGAKVHVVFKTANT